jgi:hypothetical protein
LPGQRHDTSYIIRLVLEHAPAVRLVECLELNDRNVACGVRE